MAHDYEVRSSEVVYQGAVFALRRDEVTMPGGGTKIREVVDHPGAVGIVALDEQERVVLIKQYRHAVGEALWELPAGLLDVADEPAVRAAQRELAEEVGLTAGRWDLLVEAYSSPGMSNEATRIYLARDLSQSTRQHEAAEDEEADLVVERVPIDEAVVRVASGGITNAMAVIGILATLHARGKGYERLRDVNAAWPARPRAAG